MYSMWRWCFAFWYLRNSDFDRNVWRYKGHQASLLPYGPHDFLACTCTCIAGQNINRTTCKFPICVRLLCELNPPRAHIVPRMGPYRSSWDHNMAIYVEECYVLRQELAEYKSRSIQRVNCQFGGVTTLYTNGKGHNSTSTAFRRFSAWNDRIPVPPTQITQWGGHPPSSFGINLMRTNAMHKGM